MVDYSVDMVEQMKTCSLMQNIRHLDPMAMPPERCLEYATINAAKALGLDSEIGSLESGKRADVVLFDLANLHCAPANNLLASLVYSARGADAHTVFVNGNAAVRAHRLTAKRDISDLLLRARNRAAEIIGVTELKHRTEPAWPALAPANRERN
jgi:5-methylthioadenosine/S-adenosylhomocysteine deaminase